MIKRFDRILESDNLEPTELLPGLLRNLQTKWREQGVTLWACYYSQDASPQKAHGNHIYLIKLEKDPESEGQKTNKGFQALVELCQIADKNNLPIYLVPVPKTPEVYKLFEHFKFKRCQCWGGL
jgi:hypothetical protein